MRTHTTLEGRVIDLTDLSPDLEAYLQACLAAYQHAMRWEQFAVLVAGEASPLVQAAGGRVTRQVWNHPLFQALRDLEDRLGIAQGVLAAEPGDAVDTDPWADQWLSVAEAANHKGVTVPGLHAAIKRGAVIAHPAKPGGTRLVVSANSLARWQPQAIRQQAGRRRAALASAGR